MSSKQWKKKVSTTSAPAAAKVFLQRPERAKRKTARSTESRWNGVAVLMGSTKERFEDAQNLFLQKTKISSGRAKCSARAGSSSVTTNILK